MKHLFFSFIALVSPLLPMSAQDSEVASLLQWNFAY